MRLRSITLTIASRLEEVPLLGVLVNALCASLNLPPEQRNQVEVCVVEAANNCIKHAYRFAPNRAVEVAASVFAERLEFDVMDSGTAADSEFMRADHRGRLQASGENAARIPESGRGIAIMQQFMDAVEYSSKPGRNRLRLTKRIPQQFKKGAV